MSTASSPSGQFDTVIFDLGGVLIDWNPRYLYRKIFRTEDEITWFMDNVCTHEWNERQDAGRTFAEATDELLGKFPEHEAAIKAWYGRWKETIRGSFPETVDLLRRVREEKSYGLYALTNWSAETFPWARQNFDFLGWFDGIVVSGEEKTRKPFPEIYKILLERYSINPARSIFIDDNKHNIEAAGLEGIKGIHFTNAARLEKDLLHLGILKS